MDDNVSEAGNRGHQLIVEPESGKESENFSSSFSISVEKTRDDLIDAAQGFGQPAAFQAASAIVTEFKPVPWFVWRLTNFVFSPAAGKKNLPEGFVLGLRRLLFATASDTVFGRGDKVNSLREALAILDPEVVGAVSAIHSICRRLSSSQASDRIWRPILDDALIRARIGYHVGCRQNDFGGGKGMLAGFVSRIGLAIAIARGGDDRARAALEMMAAGRDSEYVGTDLYGCHPLYIGAMVLSAIGCGGNASLGVLAHLASSPHDIVSNFEQRQWLACQTIVEALRTGTTAVVGDQDWTVLCLDSKEVQEELIKSSRVYIRRDHGLYWLV